MKTLLTRRTIRKYADKDVNEELLKFEAAQLAEFGKARGKAREMLRRDEREEAKKLLRETLDKQAEATLEFLKGLK